MNEEEVDHDHVERSFERGGGKQEGRGWVWRFV